MNFNFKKLLPQTLTILVVILVFGFFTYNAQVNMENRGIAFGYGFLSQESSFDVQFSLIEFDGSHSYFRAYLVGLLNTILVSVIGIVLATIIFAPETSPIVFSVPPRQASFGCINCIPRVG